MDNRDIDTLEIANTFFARFMGWMGRDLIPGTAILISPCSSVHTCFMRGSIDVAFIDKKGTVIKLIEDMRPWKFSAWVRGAAGVIELPAGQAIPGGLGEGRQLPVAIRAKVVEIVS